MGEKKYFAPPGGLEPPTFRLTAERASQLRHGGMLIYEPAGKYLKIWTPLPFVLRKLSGC